MWFIVRIIIVNNKDLIEFWKYTGKLLYLEYCINK